MNKIRNTRVAFSMEEFDLKERVGFSLMPNELKLKAIAINLTCSQLRLWLYLTAIDSFADRTSSGEKIYKDLPSIAELSITLKQSRSRIEKDLNVLRKHGFYDYRVTRIQGYNLTAEYAQNESSRMKEAKKAETQAQQGTRQNRRESKKAETQAQQRIRQNSGAPARRRPPSKDAPSRRENNEKIDEKYIQQEVSLIRREVSLIRRDNSLNRRDNSLNRLKKSPKPAPQANRDRSQTIQTNPDFLYSKSEEENLEDYWLKVKDVLLEKKGP